MSPLRRAWIAAVLGVALVALVGAATAVAAPRRAHQRTARPACGSRPAPRAWDHVVWIVMENQNYDAVAGSPSAPYLNTLARDCGLAIDYHAITHPSLPNYIAMTSGGTQGIYGDGPPADNATGAPSIFSELGADWRLYAESMPRPCTSWDSGSYAVRHNPAVYYTGLASTCARNNRPLPRHLTLARFTFVTPNLCHDMHDCSVASGDAWLAAFVPKVLSTSAYRSGRTAIFITWDENDGDAGNQVPLIALAPSIAHGARARMRYDHYSLLRTTEDMLGLPPQGAAAWAPSLRAAFGL